jgi:hypothetical protein
VITCWEEESLAKNIIAYVGIDNFDLILYQAGILSKLGKRVLVLDHSDTGGLSYSFPVPLGLDIEKEQATFRQVDVGRVPLTAKLSSGYDDILIAYGYQKDIINYDLCNRFIGVSDLYLHNLSRMKKVLENINDYSLVIRDVVRIKISPENVIDLAGGTISRENADFIYFNENDVANALLCQYNQSYPFPGASRDIRKYLLKSTKKLYPEINEKAICQAYKKAQKGN